MNKFEQVHVWLYGEPPTPVDRQNDGQKRSKILSSMFFVILKSPHLVMQPITIVQLWFTNSCAKIRVNVCTYCIGRFLRHLNRLDHIFA